MRTTFFSRSRRWIGASALAIIIGLGGGSAFLAATSQHVTAQAVTRLPRSRLPRFPVPPGFADLVEAVSPAVVSIVVESDEVADNVGRRRPVQLQLPRPARELAVPRFLRAVR